MRLRYRILGASWPIAKHRVPLRPIVLEYQCSPQISPIRRDHISPFLRKCWSTWKGPLASSLLLPFRRHTPSEASEPCLRAGTCSFLPDRRSTHLRKRLRLEFLLTCPNHGSASLQNVKISSRLARLRRVRRSRIYFFACARNFAYRAFVRELLGHAVAPFSSRLHELFAFLSISV